MMSPASAITTSTPSTALHDGQISLALPWPMMAGPDRHRIKAVYVPGVGCARIGARVMTIEVGTMVRLLLRQFSERMGRRNSTASAQLLAISSSDRPANRASVINATSRPVNVSSAGEHSSRAAVLFTASGLRADRLHFLGAACGSPPFLPGSYTVQPPAGRATANPGRAPVWRPHALYRPSQTTAMPHSPPPFPRVPTAARDATVWSGYRRKCLLRD